MMASGEICLDPRAGPLPHRFQDACEGLFDPTGCQSVGAAITPDRWPADFENAPFRHDVLPLILKENATPLLGGTDG